jgi:hypothetical protein
MAKSKRTNKGNNKITELRAKGQTAISKSLHRKLNIEFLV